MNFYVAESDPQVGRRLKRLIENNFDNSVLRVTTDAGQAFDDTMRLSVDIMFVSTDLQPAGGLQLIQKIQQNHHHPHFILLTKHLTSRLKTKAYSYGADLIIEEPLNHAEIEKIVHETAENIRLSRRLLQILDLASAAANQNSARFDYKAKKERRAKGILRYLGVTGGLGYRDIDKVIKVMVEQELDFEDIDILELFNCDREGKKVILQRIRRNLKKGLDNLARMCIQYPADELMMEYANNLFGFESVQAEIAKINGQQSTGGRIELEQFFNGLIEETENEG